MKRMTSVVLLLAIFAAGCAQFDLDPRAQKTLALKINAGGETVDFVQTKPAPLWVEDETQIVWQQGTTTFTVVLNPDAKESANLFQSAVSAVVGFLAGAFAQ